MANNIVTKKTLILHFTDDKNNPETSREFQYVDGTGSIYVNSVPLTDSSTAKHTIKSVNGYYVIYFSSDTYSKILTDVDNSTGEYTTYEYRPIDSVDSSAYSDLYKKMEYKRLDMMMDDDTSYSILRVNPKLTGNVKVVVDSESNMYLDTFKVSLALSQNKYRHIPINPSEYYGRTLMSKMRSIPVDDFYKIEDTCYDMFATTSDFNDQYYDKYNYGVRTNTDKMYRENYSLLAPLCIRKNLPDFFLVFKIKDYESLFDDEKIAIEDRTKFIDLDSCELIKSFDFREGTNLGSYIRRILDNNKGFVGDVYTGSDYDHSNILNGISVERGVVSAIHEDTTQERCVTNQVSMNDWYTLGFQRNHIVSKDIVNFEFMFDDTSEKLFSLPTYFGVYVRLNDEDETFTCIDIADNKAIFDSSLHGSEFNPKEYPTVIYGLSTDKDFIRLNENISDSKEAKSHLLEPYKSIATVDTYDISKYNNGLWMYVSNKMNDVLDPGEHYRILDHANNTIYEVIASNYFDDDEFSDISYTQSDINGEQFQIIRISILNTEYRSNIDGKDKADTIKKQINLITKAFNKLSDKINAYNDGVSVFSILYNKDSGNDQNVMFEKVSSICGFNDINNDIIKNGDYIDKSSYIFGCDFIEKMVIDPTSDNYDSSIKAYYPVGFENLGTRVVYCVDFMDIVYKENNETMILVNDDIQKNISSYKTVLYTTKYNENQIYKKNIVLGYLSIEGDYVVRKHTHPVYSITGFGYQESYIIKFEKTPLIKPNGKLQLYQNFPMNVGVCSIFPLRDYNFDVLDTDSVFFYKNENNPNDEIKINGKKSEYSETDTNVYNKSIIENSEEFISDYCDKYRTYNILNDFGYMDLNTNVNLAMFLSNMQNNGHNTFDISLMSPYCCKWRILGTDETGNRMRVMYNFTGSEQVYTSNDADWENGVLDRNGMVVPYAYCKTSPFIDISDNKDVDIKVIINGSAGKGDIEAIAYYINKDTTAIYKSSHTTNINKEYAKISNFIRVSFFTTHDDIMSITVSGKSTKDPMLVDSESYWIPNNDDTHIGFLSTTIDSSNSKYTKYIYNYYDEDETGGFNAYIRNSNKNGSIDDLLYRNENTSNKFSKIYKYGDNAIEFVSCGVKVRINSTDKSKINLSKYIGYSVILISMSGNNANQPGTFELFIDEIKEQVAFIVYNGLGSEYNKIEQTDDIPHAIHRIKHSFKLSDCIYASGLKIKDDGYLVDIDGSTNIVSNNSDIFLISKPTKNEDNEESIAPEQIIIYGKINDISDGYIKLNFDNSDPYLVRGGRIEQIHDQSTINLLNIGNNNVDAYIDMSTSIDTSTCTNVATNSLSLSQLRELTSSYSITIKNKNGTKKYNNTLGIINIDFVDPFNIKREDTRYKVVTLGYNHPSYAVPVMKDMFKFDYSDSSISNISDIFQTWFDGCNIILKDIGYINQTWMKKVIDINNVMKRLNSSIEVKSKVQYTLHAIPDGLKHFYPNHAYKPTDTYNEYKDSSSVYQSKFKIERIDPITSTGSIYVYDVENLVVEPDSFTYKEWRFGITTIKSFEDVYLKKDITTSKYSGMVSCDKDIYEGKKLRFVTNTLVGKIDYVQKDKDFLEGLTYDTLLYGKNVDNSTELHTFYFDGVEMQETPYGETTRIDYYLHLRTDEDLTGYQYFSKLYFVKDSSHTTADSYIKFKNNISYTEKGLSYLIYMDVVKRTKDEMCDDASVTIYSHDIDASIVNSNNKIINVNDHDEIRYDNAVDTSEYETIKDINMTTSVTLLRNHDPLIGYWYTNMCRMFSKFDTYVSHYGVFSGLEKNNYIASRGINLKSADQYGNITDSIKLTSWIDTVTSRKRKKITLDITSSIVNFISNDPNNGYTNSWNKNKKYINSNSISYSEYKSKYIENTILKLIDINNNTKFVLYVDKSSDEFEFLTEKPSDTSTYEEMTNVENNLIFSEKRYYMDIENLEPHRYYAEMIITL